MSLEGVQPGIGHLWWELEPWVLPVESFPKCWEDISIGGPRKALGQPGRKDWELRELGRNSKGNWGDALLCQPLLSRNSGNSSGCTDQDCLEHLGVDSPQKDRVGQDSFQKLGINCFSISNPPQRCRTSASPEE